MEVRPRIYVSGPITSGNRNKNYYQAIEAQRELMLAGFAPMNPMQTMVLPFAWEPDFPHRLWLDCDFPWVEVSDAVYRLPGYSVGADAECDFAQKKGIPVFYDWESLMVWKESRSTVEAA